MTVTDFIIEFLQQNPSFLWILLGTFIVIVAALLVYIFTGGSVALGKMVLERKRQDPTAEKEKSANAKPAPYETGEPPVPLYLKHPPRLEELMGESTEVWMLGLALRKTTEIHFTSFKHKLQAGGRIRTMISDHDEIDQAEILRRFARPNTPQNTVRTGYDRVRSWYQELAGAATRPRAVELRLLDFIPSIGLYVFPEPGVETLFVENYGYRTGMGSVPKMLITRKTHPTWYNLYLSQFETLWDLGRPDTGE